jgi:hypothetical protein
MEDLPVELRERLCRLNADVILDLLQPGEAVWLACDLLVAGFETPALIELAGESPTSLTRADGEPLVRQMLTELGIEPVNTTQANWLVARDIARQMIAGTLPAEVGARMLWWDLWWSCDNADEIGRMLEPLEAWDETLPQQRDDQAIRAEMRQLAHDVVRAADARIPEYPGGAGGVGGLAAYCSFCF